jgi:hypothetical protein
MSLWRKKKQQFLILFVILIIVLFLGVIVGYSLKNSTAKHDQPQMGVFLLHLRKPGWQGYIKLRNGFVKLHQNWTNSNIKKPISDTLGQNEFVQTEFDRQITEIKRISNVEEILKQTEQNQAFQDFAKKHRHESNLVFQKKSLTINDSLNRDLQQKTVETELQIQKNRYDLEQEQRLNLVNLQLQISVSDLNVNQAESKEKKNKILAEIADIKLEITQKVAAQKVLLQSQLASYEKQRRQQAKVELEDLKASLETNLEHDLAEYQAKLDSDFYNWRQNHTHEFAEAIKIRQEQREK